MLGCRPLIAHTEQVSVMTNGLNNLFIPYKVGDDGTRPLPAGVNFWTSPGVTLDPLHGAVDPSTYTVGTPCDILVEVQNNSTEMYDTISVDLWVCNPTTVADPSTALLPNASTFSNVLVTGATPTGTVTTVRFQATAATITTPATGFVPYPALTSLPGGHVCLIANCVGVTTDGKVDGIDMAYATGVNLPHEVQTNAHVAQHNLFAAGTVHPRRVSFWFMAATPLPKGHEETVLELRHQTGDAALSDADLTFLRRGPFKHLPLHPSTAPVGTFDLHDSAGATGRVIKLQLHAGKPATLSAELEFGSAEKVGGVHAFNVIQTSAKGQVQGGLRLLAVIGA
jgi:hypothetical protein